jgi:hypothetical protein
MGMLETLNNRDSSHTFLKANDSRALSLPKSTTHVRLTSSGYDPHKSGPKTFNKEDVERSRMLRGTTYNHFDDANRFPLHQRPSFALV